MTEPDQVLIDALRVCPYEIRRDLLAAAWMSAYTTVLILGHDFAECAADETAECIAGYLDSLLTPTEGTT